MSDSFSPKTISFLNSLKRNNKKEWFDKHREDYEEFVKEPAHAFLLKLKDPLAKHFPNLEVTKKGMTRINRDIRFSSDKSPYKTWVGFSFKDPSFPKEQAPGLYFGFDRTGFVFGCGRYEFSKPERDTFRTLVTSEKEGTSFKKIIRDVRKTDYEPLGKTLKKIPLGFDKDHPNSEFLLYNGCFLSQELDLPQIFYSDKFVDYVVTKFLPTAPFYKWMQDMGKKAPKDAARFMDY